MRRRLLLIALAGSLLASPALADVTVRYRAVIPEGAPANIRQNPPSLTVSADGAGQARWDMAAPGVPTGEGSTPPPSVALITREGVGYMALNAPGGAMQIVARVDDAFALGTQFARPLLRGGSASTATQQVMRQRVEITPVGPETVSGIQGNLYRIVVVTGEARTPPVDWVVATDPRLAPIKDELVRMVDSLRPTVVTLLGGEPQLYTALRGMAGLGAPLRIGDHMRVDSVSTEDVPDSRFTLPGPVMSREQLQTIVTMMTGMMQRGQGMQPPGAPASPPATPPADATNPH